MRVSSKFYQTIHTLKRMKGRQRERALSNANDNFIRDMSQTVGKMRKVSPSLLAHINPRLWRRIHLQRSHLKSFARKKTSMKKKRKFMKQKGGIIPALIPIICAAITAGGAVGSAAVGAAVARA